MKFDSNSRSQPFKPPCSVVFMTAAAFCSLQSSKLNFSTVETDAVQGDSLQAEEEMRQKEPLWGQKREERARGGGL